MSKNYAELIQARLEQAAGVAGVIATKIKGLVYYNTTNDRPQIDDGADVSQIMMEKHLPEARRDTKVQLDEAGTGNEIEGILPVTKGGTNSASVLNSQGLLFANQLADSVDTDSQLVWDNVSKKLQIGVGSTTARALTVYGGMTVESGTSDFGTVSASLINVASTTQASNPFPAMTELQRDLVPLAPTEGSGVFNLDTRRLNIYDSIAAKWIEVGSGWVKVTMSYADLTAAALSGTIEALEMVAKLTIHSIMIKHNTVFAGTGVTGLTLDVGITGELDRFVSLFDVFAPVSENAKDSTNMVFIGNIGSVTSIKLTSTSTGANLDQLTQGSVDIYFFTRSLP